MKVRILALGGLILATITLVACQKEVKDMPTSTSSITKESSQMSKETKKKESNDLIFQPVIDRYNQYISLAKTKNFNDFSEIYMAQSPKEIVPANTTYDYGYKDLQYSFYDINKDGQNELVIGTPQAISAIYYLNQGAAQIVQGAGFTTTGGVRSSLSIYENGVISFGNFTSTSPKGEITTYKIDETGLQEVKTIEVDLVANNSGEIESQLGLEGQSNVDIATLNWQKFSSQEQVANKVMDIVAIQNGDTSSIAGTWQKADGRTLTFDDKDIVSAEGTERLSPYLREINNGVLEMGVQGIPVGGYMITFIPKDIIYNPDGYQDASDSSRERIWAGQQKMGVENSGDFYYRVD